MEKKPLQAGIIGTIIMLSLMGGSLVLTEEEAQNIYFCTSNGNLGSFERFSSTYKTGYYIFEGQERSSVCRKGYWIPLTEELRQRGVSLAQEQVAEEEPIADKVVASPQETIPKIITRTTIRANGRTWKCGGTKAFDKCLSGKRVSYAGELA